MSTSDNIAWGKNKGCQFYTHACFDNSNSYPEFTTVNGDKCNFDYSGLGPASTNGKDGCYY